MPPCSMRRHRSDVLRQQSDLECIFSNVPGLPNLLNKPLLGSRITVYISLRKRGLWLRFMVEVNDTAVLESVYPYGSRIVVSGDATVVCLHGHGVEARRGRPTMRR